MTNYSSAVLPFAVGKTVYSLRGKLFHVWIILTLLLTLCAVRAETEDDYVNIFDVINQADTLSDQGKTNLAHAKYIQAQHALTAFQKANPKWNVKTVSYRLNYLIEKIAATGEKAQAPDGMPLKLLSAGAEPRKELRLRAKLGEKETSVVEVKSSMGFGGMDAPVQMMKMPSMKMTVGVTPKEITGEGDIHYEVVIEDVEVVSDADTMPGTAEAMKTSTAVIKGLVINGTMSDRGFSKAVEVKSPAGADTEARAGIDAVKQSFEEMEFVLPNEAIGAGAKWEVKQKVKSEGMTIDQTTTVQLVSIQGDVLTIKSSTVQQAANQKIPNPMSPQMQADLVKLTGSGTGDSTVDLSKLLPVNEASDEHTETTFSMNVGGQKQTMTVKSDTNMRTSPK